MLGNNKAIILVNTIHTLMVNISNILVPNTLDGKTTLNAFIRDYAGLRGTKNMCFAGGCGSCVVTVSHYDRSAQKKVTYAINSVSYFHHLGVVSS